MPKVGPALQKPFSQYLEAQRNKLHHAGGSAPAVRTIHQLQGVYFSGTQAKQLHEVFVVLRSYKTLTNSRTFMELESVFGFSCYLIVLGLKFDTW